MTVNIKILEHPPLSGTIKEAWFDAFGDCIWVEFQHDGEKWVGVFGKGNFITSANIAILFNDSYHAFIIAGGVGYVINLGSGEL